MSLAPALSAAAVVISLALITGWLKKAYPPKSSFQTERAIEDLHREYNKWELSFTVLLVLLFPPFGLAFYHSFLGLSEFYAAWIHPDGKIEHRIFSLYWGFPALLTGIIVVGLLLAWVQARMLGSRYDEYLYFTNMKHGYDGWKFLKIMILASGIFFGIFTAWGMNCYLVVQDNSIVINGWLPLGERRYLFTELQEIQSSANRKAPIGNIVNRREYVLKFENGDTWDTNDLPVFEDEKKDKARTIEFIATKAGIPVTEVEILE